MTKTELAITLYLQKRNCFCYKRNILKDINSQFGIKKTPISLTLRKMRKNSQLKLYRKRWGLQ